jgi:hypothetical protein
MSFVPPPGIVSNLVASDHPAARPFECSERSERDLLLHSSSRNRFRKSQEVGDAVSVSVVNPGGWSSEHLFLITRRILVVQGD